MRKITSLFLIMLGIIFLVNLASAVTLGTGLNLTTNVSGTNFTITNYPLNATTVAVNNENITLEGVVCLNLPYSTYSTIVLSTANSTTDSAAYCYSTAVLANVNSTGICSSLSGGVNNIAGKIPLILGLIALVVVMSLLGVLMYIYKQEKTPNTSMDMSIVTKIAVGIGLVIIIAVIVMLFVSTLCAV